MTWEEDALAWIHRNRAQWVSPVENPKLNAERAPEGSAVHSGCGPGSPDRPNGHQPWQPPQERWIQAKELRG